MSRETRAHRIGAQGESMAQLLLDRVARVTPYREDIGLDFYCELRDKPTVVFYVQAKGSSNPIYSKREPAINSISVDCKTIEDYWLGMEYPVFVLMSDITARRTYYTIVDQDSYNPAGSEQKTFTFSIPLQNQITEESIGYFVRDVVRNQPNLNYEQVERLLEEHYEKNQQLYQDLNEIDRFHETMRGSDLEAQAETKLLLKQRFENGIPTSSKLVQGLIDIFINCKDRITQIHVLDILVSLNERRVIPEILKQVERNIRLPEYRTYGEEWRRHTYVNFLFDALVKLQAGDKVEELRHFLRIRDLNVNRAAIRACGELRLRQVAGEILRFLYHADDAVRNDAVQALSKLRSKRVNRELEELLQEPPEDKLKLAGAIQTFAELKNTQVLPTVANFICDQSRDVRKAVALYLGAVDPVGHVKPLLHMMMDDDHQVRAEAGRSIRNCLPVVYRDESESDAHTSPQRSSLTTEELEALALPLLKKAYAEGKIMQVYSLLALCRGTASLPTLLDIYFSEKSPPRNYGLRGPTGDIEGVHYIHLKTTVLEILNEHNPPGIHTDVVKQIEAADDALRHKYIIAAGEMGIKAAFDPLMALIRQGDLEDRNWIISALISINSPRVQAWAIGTLRSRPPLELSFICIDIIRRVGAEEENKDLIKEQISCLMEEPENRQNRLIYNYIDSYEVMQVAMLIVGDLTKGVELSLAYRMLETLAFLKVPEGRDMIINTLPAVEDGWKSRFLEWLGRIGDPESIDAVREYTNYPAPDVSRMAKTILAQKGFSGDIE